MTTKTSLFRPFLTLLAAASVLLAGCETTPTKPEVKPAPPRKEAPPPKPAKPIETPPPVPANSADAQALKEGLALYNNGNFNDAIKKLAGSEIWNNSSDKAIQLDAAKYMAFSYCVTNRSRQCQQQFERALSIDPNFDLSPGEKGHPLWGRVFLKAKKKVKR